MSNLNVLNDAQTQRQLVKTIRKCQSLLFWPYYETREAGTRDNRIDLWNESLRKTIWKDS